MKLELDLKSIGRRIRAQREYLNLTREELAEKLGVSSKFCADIEYGVKGMSIHTLFCLSEILNLSTDYILKDYGNESSNQDEDNQKLRESIMIPLNACNRTQLKRVEQLLKIFVAAVNEESDDYAAKR